MKFLLIEGELLENSSFTPTDKFILQFVRNLNKANKVYFGEAPWLAKQFGVGADYIQKRFDFLEENGLIIKNSAGWTMNAAWWEVLAWSGKKRK